MCRLLAITASDINPNAKVDILDRSMLLLRTEFQRDGWGVSDGIQIWKGATPYSDDFNWMNEIDLTNRILIGHLRSASFGTNKTRLENHPFLFDDKHQKCPKFIAMHNGKFDGLTIPHLHNEPVSDSYYAFKKLARFTAIHSVSISNWLSDFEANSTFAFMILQNNRLFVARDETCKLFYATIGNGIMIMTSYTAFEHTKNYALIRHKIKIGPINIVPSGRLYMMDYGSTRYAMKTLTHKFRPITYSWAGGGGNFYGGSGYVKDKEPITYRPETD